MLILVAVLLILFSLPSLAAPAAIELPQSQHQQSSAAHTQHSDLGNCGENPQAQQLALLIMQDPQQQRTTLYCHPLLTQAANDKAKAMAARGIVNHYVGGLGANQRLKALGYQLPAFYSGTFGNQVEAVAGGYSSAEAVWEAFKSSSRHRSHLLGELPFYQEQIHLGVGFYYDWSSPHVEYWAVYVAREASAKDIVATCFDFGCINP